jgi:glycosyltransferase involved in cell wall biosynthesis
MDELPLISIVTPSFNQGQFLKTCIESVLSQGYPKVEYIVIDGGSRDNSIHIIEKYAGDIAYWISEPDKGQTDAINKGFHKSNGNVVAWLNADDFYLPGALAAVGRAYQRRPDASFYYGNGWRVDEAGQCKSSFFPGNQVCFDRTGLIYGLNHILQPSTFINRSCLLKAGDLNSALRYGMDTDLWIRLSEIASPEPISAFLAASREYKGTKTSAGSFDRVEELRQIAEKYSGLSLTPGVLCYFLDALHQLVDERQDIFSKKFEKKLNDFWAEAAGLMADFGCRSDGFPVVPESQREKDNQ